MGGKQDIAKKTLSETFYLRHVESGKFAIFRTVKQGQRLMVCNIHVLCIEAQRGLGIAYLRKMGVPEPYMRDKR